jgi:hypothetical protein
MRKRKNYLETKIKKLKQEKISLLTFEDSVHLIYQLKKFCYARSIRQTKRHPLSK